MAVEKLIKTDGIYQVRAVNVYPSWVMTSEIVPFFYTHQYEYEGHHFLIGGMSEKVTSMIEVETGATAVKFDKKVKPDAVIKAFKGRLSEDTRTIHEVIRDYKLLFGIETWEINLLI